MRDSAYNKPRKRKMPYRRHTKHKVIDELEPEIQKALEELPAWLQRHAHRANMH
tara:strand:- start:54615 stop:54776 length:162 start_codon:yes stop_codon:yes gene_type:complete